MLTNNHYAFIGLCFFGVSLIFPYCNPKTSGEHLIDNDSDRGVSKPQEFDSDNIDHETDVAGGGCGDGVCSSSNGETCETCILDCGLCPNFVLENIGIAGSTEKFFPDSSVPQKMYAEIEAARNEFEPFQVVINGGTSGVTIDSGEIEVFTDITGQYSVPVDKTYIYEQRFYYVTHPSSFDGKIGYWPDPLVPHIDPFYGEKRNVFPLTIASNETRALWVDLYVPKNAATGTYQGNFILSVEGNKIKIPITLRVRNFTLPSTSSLKTTYGISWDLCSMHLGSYDICGDEGIIKYLNMYGIMGLDHRITLEAIYAFPKDDNWEKFDKIYGPFFDGTANTILPGAKWTTVRYRSNMSDVTVEKLTAWREHFDAKGWSTTAKPFLYTADEPHREETWNHIKTYGPVAQKAGVASLVTTDLYLANTNNALESIDILVPLMNYTHETERMASRPEYDSWLSDTKKELWWYISCMSHGCGDGCGENSLYRDWETNWPCYVIDSTALQARALQWYSFIYDVSGELFYFTTNMLKTAWDDQCRFGGSGDGNMFYLGTPDIIGGTNHIPIGSIRLKLIREGMEDYEYLHMLELLGDREFALSAAKSLFSWHAVNNASVNNLFEVRKKLSDRIEYLKNSK